MLRQISRFQRLVPWRHFHTSRVLGISEERLTQCYALLKVPADCSNQELREAYLELAKQYHPDSNTSASADSLRFSQLRESYQTLLEHRERSGRVREETSEERESDPQPDFNYTSAQHRQYLSHDGVGFGSPFQRQNQYNSYRLDKATEAAAQYKADQVSLIYETSLAAKESKMSQRVKTRSSIDRLIEDLISQSIANGEFEQLMGAGKPLDYDKRHNPMIDCTENNLNKILIQNGYVPAWITQEKEIRESMKTLRQKLFEARVLLGEDQCVDSLNADVKWMKRVSEFKASVAEVNESVASFNLTVPWMWKQMVPYDEEREVQKVLSKYELKREAGELGEELRRLREAEKEREEAERLQTTAKHEETGLKAIMGQVKALFS